MKKIIIDPHDCHREEYNILLAYLTEGSWDFTVTTEEENNQITDILKGKVLLKQNHEVYSVFTADQWFMHDSYTSHGSFDSLETAIQYCITHELLKDHAHIQIDKYELNHPGQTKCVLQTDQDHHRDKFTVTFKQWFELQNQVVKNDVKDIDFKSRSIKKMMAALNYSIETNPEPEPYEHSEYHKYFNIKFTPNNI